MRTNPSLEELFERRINYPDPVPNERLARLVGLDDHKSRLSKILGLLVNPAGLEAWIRKHHAVADALLKSGERDAALGLIPAGTGCDLARSLSIPARDLPACARLIREGTTRVIDAVLWGPKGIFSLVTRGAR